MSQQTPPVSSAPAFWKFFALLGGLVTACCCALTLYGGALYVVVDRDISIIPTAPLDPTCADTRCLNACIRALPDFEPQLSVTNEVALLERPDGYELARYRLNLSTGELDQVALPTVPDYLKPLQTDRKLHQRIWDYFTTLFPTTDRMYTAYMVVHANNAPERFAASMQQLDGKWRLHVNLVDFDSPANVVDILTHEYAHLLTLNDDQVRSLKNEYGRDLEQTEFDAMHAQCKDAFFTGFGCAKPNAYINAYGNRFWTGAIYDQWVKAFLLADNDPAAYESAIDQLYIDHADEFVSMYSATNPREDIAEAWTEFILRPKPTEDTIAAQKVLFFYGYPELVQTRQQIIQGICQLAINQK